jgi:excisionase family DNA binding protein
MGAACKVRIAANPAFFSGQRNWCMEPFSKADTSPYVATAEAADYLKISKRTLERLRLTGGGPKYAKAGRRVLYRKSWLDQWLEQFSVENHPR